MTPKACALYDRIKLHQIKNGYNLSFEKIKNSDRCYLDELKSAGYITILYHYPKKSAPYKSIKLLK